MEKIVLKDLTEIKIHDGASLNFITASVENFADLGLVHTALVKRGNLDVVKFANIDGVTGVYEGVKLNYPVFTSVDVKGGKVVATFSLAEKTDMEKRVDLLEHGQAVQDGALLDIGDVVSELSGGGGV